MKRFMTCGMAILAMGGAVLLMGASPRIEDKGRGFAVTFEGKGHYVISIQDAHQCSHAVIKRQELSRDTTKVVSSISNKNLRDGLKKDSGWLLLIKVYKKGDDGKFDLQKEYLLEHKY